MYKDRTRDFPIVGIGASAGGLEAMELFLKTCRNIQVCGVVIQHLDPTHVNFTGTIATQYCYGSTTGH
jgi:two-component system CheB/CheR fusion protein